MALKAWLDAHLTNFQGKITPECIAALPGAALVRGSAHGEFMTACNSSLKPPRFRNVVFL
jgi:hypothetical protein